MVLVKKPSVIESPPVGRRKRPLDVISWVQKVVAVEKWFRGSPGCFQGIRVYMGKIIRSGEPRGAHKTRRVPSTLVVASWLLRLHLQVSWFASGPRKIIAKVLFHLVSFSTKL